MMIMLDSYSGEAAYMCFEFGSNSYSGEAVYMCFEFGSNSLF
jgi:hypothetical protein